jgi:hypothetical protein
VRLATTDCPTRVLDLRTYRVVPGGRAALDRLFREDALPMLERAGIEVLAFGPSLVDDDHYFLARAFDSVAERDTLLQAFYGSEEWRTTCNEAVSSLLDAYQVVVVPSTPGLHAALAP